MARSTYLPTTSTKYFSADGVNERDVRPGINIRRGREDVPHMDPAQDHQHWRCYDTDGSTAFEASSAFTACVAESSPDFTSESMRLPSSSAKRISSSASRLSCSTPSPATLGLPAPPTALSRRAVSATAFRTTSAHVVFSFARAAAISSLILRHVPTPSYANRVYTCTAAAPARAYSSASAPDEIPPHPMRGTDSGRSARKVRSVASVYGFNGGPDSPPVSSLFAASPCGSDRHAAEGMPASE